LENVATVWELSNDRINFPQQFFDILAACSGLLMHFELGLMNAKLL